MINSGSTTEITPRHGRILNPSAGRYRRDIDGLRAVAVISVILYHLNRSYAPGGFVGVDIFFVISGFVVTGSVLASPVSSPLQAMARFWRRRILRILPALLLMIIFSSFAIAMFAPPFPAEGYNGDFKTGISAIFGLGNFYLYRSGLDYFRAEQATNPFLHTWSLGVEEQFYFVYAVLFIGVIGFFGRNRMRLNLPITAMSVLCATSYVAFLTTAAARPSRTYYFLPFRFWEIAIGSLLAYCDTGFPNALRFKRGMVTASVQLFALGCLITIVGLARSSRFPIAQISAAGASTALLIMTGKDGNGPISRILSAPIFVWGGLISYPLYLWHYPILLFWGSELGLDHFGNRFLALSAVLIAAILSYRTVEVRFRRSRSSFRRVLLPGLAVSIGAGIGSTWFFQQHPGIVYLGARQSWTDQWVPRDDHAFYGRDRITKSACLIKDGGVVPTSLPDTCSSTDRRTTASQPTVLVVGDSHAVADWGMVAYGAAAGAFRFATLTHVDCWPGTEPSMESQSCRVYWEKMPALVGNTLRRNDSLLIALFWQPTLHPRTAIETRRAMNAIATIAQAAKDQGAGVIIEAPLPTFERPAYLCTTEWYRTNYKGCAVDRSEVEQKRGSVISELRALMARERNIRLWDPLPILCPNSTCSQFVAGKPIFSDRNHLSYFGSTSLGPAFASFWQRETAPQDLNR